MMMTFTHKHFFLPKSARIKMFVIKPQQICSTQKKKEPPKRSEKTTNATRTRTEIINSWDYLFVLRPCYFAKKNSFISFLRLRRSGIMNGRNETRGGGICMCVDLIIFLFLSMEHLLLWLSAKLFVLWFFALLIFAFAFFVLCRVRKRESEKES